MELFSPPVLRGRVRVGVEQKRLQRKMKNEK
jgi:hypothetical protein